jgi:AcrR family transcriptional regulator
MTIPLVDREPRHPAAPTQVATESASEWAGLETEAKRERLLRAAAEVFAREGLDAPMPAVAAAAGAGVASIYRQFPSKHELLSALVTRRLTQVADAARSASAREGNCWSALTEMLWMLVEQEAADTFLGEARIAVAAHPDVVSATEQATRAFESLLAGARAEGRLRADASMLDIRLLFAATRAAKHVEPQAWPRMLELLIDALDTDPGARARGGHSHRVST